MKRILVIDDNEDIRMIIGYSLMKAGYQVDDAEDGQAGLQKINEHNYDLMIIDWMMPNMNGIELVRKLRREHVNSIIFMLTAKDGVDDLVEAFDAGVDDYMRKPFSPRELSVRVNLHLEQTQKKEQTVLRYGDIELNEQNRKVFLHQQPLSLTRKEFDLLAYFMNHPDTVVSRDQILNDIWGYHYDGDTRVVDVHTFKLRSKLKDSCIKITSSRGIGYILEKK